MNCPPKSSWADCASVEMHTVHAHYHTKIARIVGKIMADKCDNDMFTGKAGKGKRKLRGPYNQYLSQPEANIPRSTLQKWPKTTSVNNTLPAKSSSESMQPTSTCFIFKREFAQQLHDIWRISRSNFFMHSYCFSWRGFVRATRGILWYTWCGG